MKPRKVYLENRTVSACTTYICTNCGEEHEVDLSIYLDGPSATVTDTHELFCDNCNEYQEFSTRISYALTIEIEN